MKEIVLTSSVLILTILLCRFLFRRKVSQRLVYGLWLLVVLRLLIPVQIDGFHHSFLSPTEPLTKALSELSQTPVNWGYTQEHLPEEENLHTPQNAIQVQPAFTLGELARIVWLFGAIATGVWFLGVNMRHSRQLLRRAESVEAKESPIPVMVSPAAESPCLVGFFRPKIFLPLDSTKKSRMKYVLAHELGHYRQGDHLWSLVRCVCLCLYWFHPLVWIAAFCSRRDCELACDEIALVSLDEDERLAYGAALIATAAQNSHRANPLHIAINMANSKTQLKERVEHIVKKPKTFVPAAVCMLLVCVICAGCGFMGSTPDPTEPAQLQIPQPISPTAPAETVDMEQTDEFHSIISVINSSNIVSGEATSVSITTINNDDTMFTYGCGGGNPHYVDDDGNVYFVTSRHNIVRCLPDGSRVLVIYTGKEMLHPLGCDGESFYFTEGNTVMALNCQTGEARPVSP